MLRPALPVAAVAAALLLAACGSSKSSTSSDATTKAAAATPAPSSVSGKSLSLSAKDFAFSAKALTAKAGRVTIKLTNMGPSPHEFVLLKTSAAPGALKVSGGRVSETGSVGEIGDVDPSASKSHTFDLKPGRYVFVCNIPGHYADGMHGSLVVS